MSEGVDVPEIIDTHGERRITQGEARLVALRALAAAQRSMGPVGKTGKNPHFKSKYVKLDTLLDAISETLTEHQLFIVQTPQSLEDGRFVLETIIAHENGAVAATSTWPVTSKDMNDPQKVGGGVTYARRYAIMTMLNIAGDDDDGNLAAQPAAKSPAEQLVDVLKDKGIKGDDFKKRIKTEYGKERLVELSEKEIKTELSRYKNDGAPF